MPRAFLMQYNKRDRVPVVLQEADTTIERRQMEEDLKPQPLDLKIHQHFEKIHQHSVVMENYGQYHHGNDEEEDIEISVTDESDLEDEEEEEEEDLEEEIENETLSENEAGCENEAVFDNEALDDSEELIVADDNEDCKKSTESATLYSRNNERNEEQDYKVKHEGLTDEAKDGNKQSAFSKPPPLIFDNSRVLKGSKNGFSKHMDMGSYLDQHAAMTNYWLHLSKLYGSQMGMPPIGPFPHPSMMLSSNAISHFQMSQEMIHKRAFLAAQQEPFKGPIRSGLHGQPPIFPPNFPLPPSGAFPFMFSPQNSFREPGEIGIRSLSDSAVESSNCKKKFTNSLSSPKLTSPRRHSISTHSPSTSSPERSHAPTSTPISPIQSPVFTSPATAKSFPTHMSHPSLNGLCAPFPGTLLPPPHIPSLAAHRLSTPSAMPGIRSQENPVSHLTAITAPPPPPPSFLFPTGSVYGARRPRDPNKPPPVKKYKCDICAKAFSRSNTLVTHRRIHTGEKPFQCEVCSRAFRQPGNLTRHRLTHTSVKPYVCVVCKKAFNRASNLHTHMRTHTNFRPFLCPYCGKGFQQKVDMKIHMYTHGNRH